jgi:aspartate kinase
MQIFKFGGASIKTAQAIQNVANILQSYLAERPVLVVSALGKTTNALEAILHAYLASDIDQAQTLLEALRAQHLQIVAELFPEGNAILCDELNDLFVDIEWAADAAHEQPYAYSYDQIVSVGELLSTKILAAYLNKMQIPTHWLDARDCIRTDNTYRDANIDWKITQQQIISKIVPLQAQKMVLTQGFIGSTSENFSTTLGREGSDYTASILAYCLDAENMTVWKDVAGVFSGDPSLFEDMVRLETLSYEEAIEMTYYGASVIHPKTIKPLQNKQIPLYVRSFLNPSQVGTTICNPKTALTYPPIIVVKKNQSLLKLSSRGFYFVDEAQFAQLFQTFANLRIKVNMTQNTALGFSVCVNTEPEKLAAFQQLVEKDYKVELIHELKIITFRHATDIFLQKFEKFAPVLLEERMNETIQWVVSEKV